MTLLTRTVLRVSKVSPTRASPQLAAQVHRQTEMQILFGREAEASPAPPPLPKVDLVLPWDEAQIREAADKHCLATWGVKDQMFPSSIV